MCQGGPRCCAVSQTTTAIWLSEALTLSRQALKTIEKKGLQAMAKDIGLDLEKLPYEDTRKARTEWLAKQPKYPPQVGIPSMKRRILLHSNCLVTLHIKRNFFP